MPHIDAPIDDAPLLAPPPPRRIDRLLALAAVLGFALLVLGFLFVRAASLR